MTLRTQRGFAASLVLVSGAYFATGCSYMKASKQDDRKNGSAQVTKDSGDAVVADKNSGRVSFAMPLTGDIDKVVVTVCSQERLKKEWHHHGGHHGHHGYGEPQPYPDHDTGWSEGTPPVPVEMNPTSVPPFGGEVPYPDTDEVPYPDTDEDYEDDKVSVLPMPWPSPDDEKLPFGRWCEVVSQQSFEYEAGKVVTMNGVPFGPALVRVVLYGKKGMEAGWGKAFVAPGETATVTVEVFPVAENGDLAIEIVRYGDDWPQEFTPPQPTDPMPPPELSTNFDDSPTQTTPRR